MKCISLYQPWATLVACGQKRYETRSWSTAYRGALAIHAAKKWSEELAALCQTPPYREALAACGFKSPHDLPRGVLLGVVTLRIGGSARKQSLARPGPFPPCFPFSALPFSCLDVRIPLSALLGLPSFAPLNFHLFFSSGA